MADAAEKRLHVTRVLAELDLMFSVMMFNREKDERTWLLQFEMAELDESAVVQLAYFGDWLTAFNVVQAAGPIAEETLRKFLFANGTWTAAAIAVNDRVVSVGSHVSASRIDADSLRQSIASVLHLAKEARKAMRDAALPYTELTGSGADLSPSNG